MNIDLTRKRDELADKRSKRQCSTGNPDLDRAIAWYLKIGFEDGFDAGVAEMRAQVEKLRNEAISPKELTKLRRCSKGHVFVYGHPGKPFDHSPDCIFCLNTDKLTQERDALKAQLEIAVKALEIIVDLSNDEGHEMGCTANQSLEQIQKMRGG